MCGGSEPGRPVGPAGGSTHAQPAPGRGPSVCVPQQGQREWDVWVTGNMRPWQRGGDLCYYSVALTYTDKTHRGVDFQHTLCLFLILTHIVSSTMQRSSGIPAKPTASVFTFICDLVVAKMLGRQPNNRNSWPGISDNSDKSCRIFIVLQRVLHLLSFNLMTLFFLLLFSGRDGGGRRVDR